jgi:hypothetical protein
MTCKKAETGWSIFMLRRLCDDSLCTGTSTPCKLQRKLASAKFFITASTYSNDSAGKDEIQPYAHAYKKHSWGDIILVPNSAREELQNCPSSFVGVDEMVLVVQTVSYINYELHIGWPWQWGAVMSLVTSQWHSGFSGENNSRITKLL